MRPYSLALFSMVLAVAGTAAAQSISEVPNDLPKNIVMAVTLGNELHTGKARVGTIVVMNLAKPIHRSGKPDVPAGAALVGRVSDLQRKESSTTKTRVSVCMDYLQWQSQSMPIHATIVGFDWTIVESAEKGIVSPQFTTPPPPNTATSNMSILLNRTGRNLLPDVGIVADEKLGTVLVSNKKDIVIAAGTKLYLRQMSE